MVRFVKTTDSTRFRDAEVDKRIRNLGSRQTVYFRAHVVKFNSFLFWSSIDFFQIKVCSTNRSRQRRSPFIVLSCFFFYLLLQTFKLILPGLVSSNLKFFINGFIFIRWKWRLRTKCLLVKLFFLAVEKNILSMGYHFFLKFVVVVVLICKMSSGGHFVSMDVCHRSLGSFMFCEFRLFRFCFCWFSCKNLRGSHCQNGSC